MGALSLTNGALLGGLALLAAPILAHLMQRRARRPIVFPSILFLQECAAQHSRLHRLKRLILLALRMLAVAGIVLAFTRPVWLSAQFAGRDSREAAAAVVVLVDASLSASQQSSAGSVFPRLTGSAARILDEIRSGVDLANVVVADDSPRAVFPRMTLNLSALQSELQTLQPTQARADFDAAIAVAARLLETHEGPSRLIVLTDFQATNWSEALAESGTKLLPPKTDVTLADVAGGPEANLGLSQPECFPAIPAEGQTVDLSVKIQNASETTQQAVVSLEIASLSGGPRVTEEQTIVLPPRQSRRAVFSVVPPAGALQATTFRLTGADSLPGDNTAFLIVGSAQPVPVLVVSDDAPEEPGTAAYYLTRALAPREGLEDVGAVDRLAVRHVSAARLTADDLKGVSAVFLGYLGVLREETGRLLADFVRNGGGLVLFCGEGPADRNVAILNQASNGLMVPWQLVSHRTLGRGEPPLRISSGRWQSKWFREFDERSQLAIREIGFRSVWTAAAPSGDSEVLLLFSDGRPALGARSYGRGQFVIANFSPEVVSSDLGKHGPFVAMTQILAATLHHSAENAHATRVGEAIRFPGRVPAGIHRVLGPDRKEILALRTETAEGGQISVSRAPAAGIYELQLDDRPFGAVAVNVDPRESDLTHVELETLTQRLQSSAGEATSVAVGTGDLNLQGRALWGEFFTMALLALATELLLLGIWRR